MVATCPPCSTLLNERVEVDRLPVDQNSSLMLTHEFLPTAGRFNGCGTELSSWWPTIPRSPRNTVSSSNSYGKKELEDMRLSFGLDKSTDRPKVVNLGCDAPIQAQCARIGKHTAVSNLCSNSRFESTVQRFVPHYWCYFTIDAPIMEVPSGSAVTLESHTINRDSR